MNSLNESSRTNKIVFVSGTAIINGAFAIESDGGANIELYMINPDGTSLTRLTETTAKKYEANRLPDGTRIKIVWDTNGRMIMSISNGVRSDTLDLVGLPSPDGRKAVFVEQASTSSVSPTNETDDLYVRTDSGTKKLKDTGTNSNETDESEPVFSPDSEKLAFIRAEDVYVANADGSEQTNLTSSSAEEHSPVWLPGSEKIAFVRFEGGWSGDIYVINADGTSLTQLTTNAPVGGNLLISPDGKQIAFLGQPAGDSGIEGQPYFDLYVINADGTSLTNLSDKVTHSNKATGSYVTVDSFQRFLFSPDSKQIAFVSSRTVPSQPIEHDLYAVNVDGTNLTRLTNTDTWESVVTWVWK